jgi:xanthine dehydrogenase accessory factor
MKEIQAIIAAFEQHQDQAIALATVIEVSGSTYRRAGAKMLMTENGYRVGSISGGCLEEDVFEQAQAVMASGKATVIQYDTTSADDIIWGLGLGCNGKVRVFIERLTPNQFNPVLFIAESWRQRQPAVIATVVNSDIIGKHLLLQPDGKVISENDLLKGKVLEDAKIAFNHKSLLKLYQLPQGEAEVFIEVIQPPVPLVIFGAGDDAVPVVEFAKALGWQVTVVDSRPAYAKREVFSKADQLIITRPEQISEYTSLDARTVAVVMTHNYLHDQEILRTLLPSVVSYIGILGPKSRTQQILKELQEESIYPTQEQLQRLYSPIGLDIGADTPEAIALSIIAEIQTVLAAHSGGFLKNRNGPIHQEKRQKVSHSAIL